MPIPPRTRHSGTIVLDRDQIPPFRTAPTGRPAGRRADLEGQWDGKLLAAMTSRAIEIEEEKVDLQALEEPFPEHTSERSVGMGVEWMLKQPMSSP